MAKLIVRYPNNEIKEVDFDKPVYRIGRAPDNDLVLDNEDVDEHQAVIENANGVFTLVDTSENKSTKVNGKDIDRVNITYGDRISFGSMVALFYPSKKGSGLSDRLKLILYISAGAVIIIASIVLIFVLITPKISSSVAKSIGGTYLESQGVATVGKIPEGVTGKSKKTVQKEKKVVVKPVETRKEIVLKKEKKSFFKSVLSIFKPKVKVSLPEPTENELSNRRAIAIPHGLRRLFFRKKVVYVDVPLGKQGEKEIQKEIEKWEKDKVGSEQPTEINLTKETKGIKAPEVEELQPVEATKNKGPFGVVLSPFKKAYNSIFKRKKQTVAGTSLPPEQGEGEAKGEGEPPKSEALPAVTAPAGKELQAGVVEERVAVNRLPKESLESKINPLIELNKIEIFQVKSRLPEETPIYSADELKRINKQSLVENIALSERENLEIDTLWKYPSALGLKPPGKIIYTGSVAFINDDKYPDFTFITKDGKLVSLSGKDGEEILSLDLKSPTYNPIITGKGKKNSDIIVIYKNGKIESYKKTSEKKWFAIEDHPITALPVLTDINGDKIDDIIVSTLGMEIIAINGANGFELWRFTDLTGDVDSSPVAMDVNGDRTLDIIVNSIDGYVNVIDGKTGWGLWKRKIYGRPAGPPLTVDLDGDGKKEIITLTRNGILTGYSTDGKNLFTISLEKKFIIPPSAGDVDNNGKIDLVYMSTDGVVQAIEGRTRRVLWEYETEEKTSFGRIAMSDMNLDKSQDVIFTTPSGLVYILDGVSGTPLSIFNAGDFILATPIIYDFNKDKVPEVIVPTYDGIIYCLKETGVKKPFIHLSKSYWPYKNHDIRNSGVSKIKSDLLFWK